MQQKVSDHMSGMTMAKHLVILLSTIPWLLPVAGVCQEGQTDPVDGFQETETSSAQDKEVSEAGEEDDLRSGRIHFGRGVAADVSGEITDKYKKEFLGGKRARGMINWVRIEFPLDHPLLFASFGAHELKSTTDHDGLVLRSEILVVETGGGIRYPLRRIPSLSMVAEAAIGLTIEDTELSGGAGTIRQSANDLLAGSLRGGAAWVIWGPIAAEVYLHAGTSMVAGLTLGGTYAF